jgi:hypothetical protein
MRYFYLFLAVSAQYSAAVFAGASNGIAGTVDGSTPTFFFVTDAVADSSGNFFVADYANNRIRRGLGEIWIYHFKSRFPSICVLEINKAITRDCQYSG